MAVSAISYAASQNSSDNRREQPESDRQKMNEDEKKKVDTTGK
jgi:hypothetical protein